MSLKSFFSKQAREPSGIFGRYVMPVVFDRGNMVVNKLMGDLLELEENDRVLEIGFGTGKFINDSAKLVKRGRIEGIDFSDTMVAVATRKNKKYIAAGKVIIRPGDFEETDYRDDSYDKICSANTIYFWPNPDGCLKKVLKILKPGGKLLLAFEDIDQLESRSLDGSVFKFYRPDEIENLLYRNGFSGGVNIFTKQIKSKKYHCAVAVK
jgi:ubiquinone/menaquinone biosynthesis C-methylase UbiE